MVTPPLTESEQVQTRAAPELRLRASLYQTVALQFLSAPVHLDPALNEEMRGNRGTETASQPGWPILLSRSELCAYLGMSWSTISKVCPVAPVDVGANRVLYSRPQIDDWIATRPPRRKGSGPLVMSPPCDVQLSPDPVTERRSVALNRVLARAVKRK